MKPLSVAVLLAHILLTGCASIVASTTEPLRVVSKPSGAQVRLNGAVVGVTPTTLNIPRKLDPFVVEVGMDGYRSQSCPVRHAAGGGYIAGDVVLCVLFCPIGCISFIDAGGAWNQIDSPVCTVELQPEGPISPTAPPAAVFPGCAQDNDCKGDRICEAGRCVPPIKR